MTVLVLDRCFWCNGRNKQASDWEQENYAKGWQRLCKRCARVRLNNPWSALLAMREACEFDYFLAAQEIDPTTVRYAYLKADGVEALAAKQVRLADITGRGKPPVNGDRRSRDEVARTYGSDPSGAGARIRAGKPVVTDRLAQVAADPQRRSEYEATGKGRERATSKFWRVRWSDDTSTAEAIAGKLLEDPELANEVRKILHAHDMCVTRTEQKRRSGTES